MKLIKIFSAAAIALSLMISSCSMPTYSKDDDDDSGSASLTSYSALSSTRIPVSSESVAANINSSDFVRGFDASMLYDLEHYGAKFYNAGNSKEDMLSILAENGVNCIRLRVWNDPYNAASTPSMENYGYNTIEKAAEIGKRAKNLGMKVLIDFHYSDTWTDPTHQLKPKAWDNISTISALGQAVYDFTYNSVTYLAENGASPDFVQIGNEIDSGMFLTSSSNDSTTVTAENGSSNLAEVLNKAGSAVKTANPNAEVIIHIARPSYYTRITSLSGLESSNYDAIAVSYYPCLSSHGTISKLKESLAAIVSAGKKAYVAELSFPWTCEWVSGKNDSTNNTIWYTGTDSTATAYTNLSSVLSAYGIESSDYSESKIVTPSYENQAAVIKAVIATVGEAGGSGIFYWGGDWVATTSIPSSWENQTLFDLDGKVLPSIEIFSAQAEYSGTINTSDSTGGGDDTTETALITALTNDTANATATISSEGTYQLAVSYDAIKDYNSVYITLANITAWGDGKYSTPALGTDTSTFKVSTTWKASGFTDSNVSSSTGGYEATITPSDYTSGVYITGKTGLAGTLYVTGVKNTGGGE